MIRWLWDYFWFWTLGWWVILVVVLPFSLLLPRLNQWGWDKHPRLRQWIARTFCV